MKVYISGQMTGVENYNFDRFFEVEKKLIQQGYTVVNPARLSLSLSKKFGKKLDDIPKELFLKEDIKHLLNCDKIYMMIDWKKSDGAKLEYLISQKINIDPIFEKEVK